MSGGTPSLSQNASSASISKRKNLNQLTADDLKKAVSVSLK